MRKINLDYNAKFYSIVLNLHQKAQAGLMTVGRNTNLEELNKITDSLLKDQKRTLMELKDLKKRIAD